MIVAENDPTPSVLRALRDIRDGHITVSTMNRRDYIADRIPPAGMWGKWWEPLIKVGLLRLDWSTCRLEVTDEGRKHLRNAGMGS